MHVLDFLVILTRLSYYDKIFAKPHVCSLQIVKHGIATTADLCHSRAYYGALPRGV